MFFSSCSSQSRASRKIVAAFLTQTLVFLNLFNSTPALFAASQHPAQNISPLIRSSKLESFKFIQDAGRIEGYFKKPDSKQTVWLIQDAHAVPDAQKSLRDLLLQLEKKEGVRKVYFEGSDQPLDSLLLQTFPFSVSASNLLENYLKSGELSGITAAAAESSADTEYQGVENAELYNEGERLYRQAQTKTAEQIGNLKSLESQIHIEQNRVYSETLLSLEKSIQDFQGKKISWERLLLVLKPYRKLLADFPSVMMIMDEAEDLVQTPEVLAQVRRLESALKKVIRTRVDQIAFHAQVQAFQTERVTLREHAAFLADWTVRYQTGERIPLAFEKARLRAGQLRMLPGSRLMEEWESALDVIRFSLAKKSEAQIVMQLDRMARTVSALSRMELTRRQWEYLKNEIQTQAWKKTGAAYPAMTRLLSDILEAMSTHQLFYENAEAREEAMLQNFLGLDPRPSTQKVLVVGGFHAQKLMKKLYALGYSVVLVSPKIQNLPDHTVYESLMQGRASWMNSSRIRSENIFYAFHESVLQNYEKENGPLSSADLRAWRRAVEAELVRQGRIDEMDFYKKFLDPMIFQTLPYSKKRALARDLPAGQIVQIGGAAVSSGSFTMEPRLANPTARPLGFARRVPKPAPVLVRSELRFQRGSWAATHVPELAPYSIFSRQFEAGLPRHILRAIREKYGREASILVAQLTMTGGLGALMHDLFDAWRKNGLDNVRGMMPYYNSYILGRDIPTQYKGSIKLGDILKEFLQDTHIRFKIHLDADDDFRHMARLSGDARVLEATNRDLDVHVFCLYTQAGTPVYSLDISYKRGDGEKVSIFDGLYPGNHDNPWLYIQMAAFNVASGELASRLEPDPEKIFYVNNEVYVSLPPVQHPDALRHDVNHSVVENTMPKPRQGSYGVFKLPPGERNNLVRHGRIHLSDLVGTQSDGISSVSVGEHGYVMGEQVFPGYRHKLKNYNDGRYRSTNGVLEEQWRSPEMMTLIRKYKQILGMPAAEDKEFSETLPEHPELWEQFNLQHEWIAARDAADLYRWLAEEQSQPAWLDDAVTKFYERKATPAAQRMSGLDLVNQFKAAVAACVNGHAPTDAAAWQALETQWGPLRDIMMENPVLINVRRQVEYKGPTLWHEILSRVKSTKAAVEAAQREGRSVSGVLFQQLAEVGSRVLFGGRTFDDQARGKFREMRGMVLDLQIGDRFATIAEDEYNIFDAPIIFRAAAGAVMLSREFAEASATSMMKMLMNHGALVGVFGGADPELFTVVDNKTNQPVDLFSLGKEFWELHDLLKEKVEAGEWRVTNGFPIWYKGKRRSKDEPARQPDVDSLQQRVLDLGRVYKNPQERRRLQWEVFASSWKADMERGQARAHAYIWRDMIKEREQQKNLTATFHPSPRGASQVLESTVGFDWRLDQHPPYNHTVTAQTSAQGLLGFISGFHALRTKGQTALYSVLYHAANGTEEGDLIRHAKHLFARVSEDPTFQPFWHELHLLEVAARGAKTKDARASVNLKLMDLLEWTAGVMAASLFKSYVLSQPGDERSALEKVIADPQFRGHLARYWDRHPDFAVPVKSTSDKIRVYAVHVGSEKVAVALNVGEFVYPHVKEEQEKAWTRLYGKQSFIELMGAAQTHDLNSAFQVSDVMQQQNYGEYAMWSMLVSGIPIGVPKLGIQILRLRPTAASIPAQGQTPPSHGLERMLQAAISGEFVDEEIPPSEIIVQQIQGVRDNPAQLKALLDPIASLSREEAGRLFQSEGIPSVMALVATLQPQLLDKMKTWNEAFYRSIAAVIRDTQNTELFEHGVISFHQTDRHTAIVVSRAVNGGRRIFVPIHFSRAFVNQQNNKIWFRIVDLASYLVDIHDTHDTIPDAILDQELVVRNWMTGALYPKNHRLRTLLESWEVGLSVVEQPGERGPTDLGGQFQILEFNTPEGTPYEVANHAVSKAHEAARSEMRLAEGTESKAGNWLDREENNLRGKFKNFSPESYVKQAEQFLDAHPDQALHFAWASEFSGDPQMTRWLRGFLKEIASLKSRRVFSDQRLSVNLALIANHHSTEHAEAIQAEFPNQVKVIDEESSEAAKLMNGFLADHPNALYDAPEALADQVRNDSAYAERRLVFREVLSDEVFPLTAQLYFLAARESLLSAETLSKMPQLIPGDHGIVFNGHLVFSMAAREWLLRAQADRLVSSMA